ncbi:chromate efflux transporter [Tabrizicola oligotrophica]|uniref:Chromate efflux transporter n=1 Tax=Tabrizicola oligotrophica TaxID=2710650 RepID=A0A6M0QXB8_9RHOB|nr:chromate efflux transporter [Tabrizicola oligotrophica]NEY91343.1 chromate efflux transporter [Tabrizicola oligotrophica]
MTPSLADLTRAFARIGVLSFGGPAAQIALMHREIVDEHGWVEEKDYLSALSFCMLLPGPEAMQLATWIGWRTHGTLGGLIAGGLFVLPGACVVLALSAIYAAFGGVPLVAAAFQGIQAAVVAIVIEALLRVSRRALKGRTERMIALAAFLGLFALALPFPVVILAAGLAGAAWLAKGTAPLSPAPHARRDHSLRTALIWSAVWLGPLAALWLIEAGLLAQIGLYFSKLALLTFGGAYAVLAWMVQEVVQVQGWLSTAEMMDGLGLAETTPGPLILVTEFVGFMAGWHAGGWAMALAGAAVALWMTFAPCFLWIFLGAPHIARLTAQPRLAGALAGIMAAVVGVIANLSLWFALHVIFGTVTALDLGPLRLSLPDPTSLKPVALGIAGVAAWLLLRRHWPLPAVLATAALASTLATLI